MQYLAMATFKEAGCDMWQYCLGMNSFYYS